MEFLILCGVFALLLALGYALDRYARWKRVRRTRQRTRRGFPIEPLAPKKH